MKLETAEAVRTDLRDILASYNEVIRNSTAVYSEVEFTAPRGDAWFDAKVAQGFPFIVARHGSEVVGFGSFGDFRAWPCYQFSVEHSVHVRADRRGQGIGRALVVQLIALARSGIPTAAALNRGSKVKIRVKKAALRHSCFVSRARQGLRASES